MAYSMAPWQLPWLPAGQCFWHLGKAVKSRRGLELPPPQLRKEAIPTLCLSSSPVLGKLYRSLQKPWQVHGYSVPLRGTRSCLDLQCQLGHSLFSRLGSYLLSRQEMPSLSLAVQQPGIKKRGSIQKKSIRKRKNIHSTVLYLLIL